MQTTLGDREYERLLAAEREENDLIYKDIDPTSPPDPDMRDVAMWIRYAGDLRGKNVVEVGSGDGRRAVWLASQGAFVHAVELSPVGVSKTLERARNFDLADRVRAYPIDATKIDEFVSPGSIDLVVGFSVLHHLPAAEFGRCLRKVLRAGGRVLFCENSAANPLYRFGRWVRNNETACGSPLSGADAHALIEAIGSGECIYPRFGFFGLMKKYIFQNSRFFGRVVETLDSLMDRIPGSRRWSAHMWVLARRA